MILCLNCQKEVIQTEGKKTRLYCDDACKKSYQRKTISGHNIGTNSNRDIIGTDQNTISGQKPKRYITPDYLALGVTCPTAPVDDPAMIDLDRAKLYSLISNCPGITWIDSPAYAELIDRLLTISPEGLKQGGYFVPSWVRTKNVA